MLSDRCPVCLSCLSVTLVDQDETWPQPHCVRWDPASKGGGTQQPPTVQPVCCGQMAGWMRMPLGTEVSLGPGHIVLDDESPKRAQQPPIFGLCLLWPNGWMDQDATWYGGRPRSWPHCVRWRLTHPERTTAPPELSDYVCCMAKRPDGSRCHFVSM